ncbi:MAG: hypothetical protein JW969_03805 [Spirochaetales bacterium]|nr:hypothetical protein [Spirochaetales bacterium]
MGYLIKLKMFLSLFFLISFPVLTHCSTDGITPAQKFGTQWIGEEKALFVSADDARITYTGRVDFRNRKEPRFDWPGVTIRAGFSGTSIAVQLVDGRNDYDVIIDDQEPFVLVTEKGMIAYTLARNLGRGTHEVTLVKRTEAFHGMAVFKGFYLDAGCRLFKLETPRLKMEIIGDSISCGYGIGTTEVDCGSARPFEDIYRTYGVLAARALDAGYSIVAISGKGMVRNFREEATTSKNPLPYYYGRTCMRILEEWDFKSWIPDIVLINLGTNDYSTKPNPLPEEFIEGYKNFIMTIRSHYPKAHIVCLSGPTLADTMLANITAVAEEMGEIDGKVHLFIFQKLSTRDEYGCAWHPNALAHEKMAQQLIPFLKELTARD